MQVPPRITGKSGDEVLGNDDTVLFPPDEAKTVMEGDRGVIASGKTMTYEEHVTTVDGRVVELPFNERPYDR